VALVQIKQFYAQRAHTNALEVKYDPSTQPHVPLISLVDPKQEIVVHKEVFEFKMNPG
jgi:hypothetical protein